MFSSYGYDYGIDNALSPYGTLWLTESSPPQSWDEPITLDEIKQYLVISTEIPDTRQDDALNILISAAREQAEILQQRDLVIKQWDLVKDYWTEYKIRLRAPLITVDLVQYTDSTGATTKLTQNTDYVVDTNKQPGLIVPPYGSVFPNFTPWPSSAILIRFTSGYGPTSPFWDDAGARIKAGMKLLISAWFNNRLPFEKGYDATSEYPYAVTHCLSTGAIPIVR